MRNKFIEEKWVTAMQTTDLMTEKPREPTVNWSGVGAVSVDEAREFAKRILSVCDKVENGEWE